MAVLTRKPRQHSQGMVQICQFHLDLTGMGLNSSTRPTNKGIVEIIYPIKFQHRKIKVTIKIMVGNINNGSKIKTKTHL